MMVPCGIMALQLQWRRQPFSSNMEGNPIILLNQLFLFWFPLHHKYYWKWPDNFKKEILEINVNFLKQQK